MVLATLDCHRARADHAVSVTATLQAQCACFQNRAGGFEAKRHVRERTIHLLRILAPNFLAAEVSRFVLSFFHRDGGRSIFNSFASAYCAPIALVVILSLPAAIVLWSRGLSLSRWAFGRKARFTKQWCDCTSSFLPAMKLRFSTELGPFSLCRPGNHRRPRSDCFRYRTPHPLPINQSTGHMLRTFRGCLLPVHNTSLFRALRRTA